MSKSYTLNKSYLFYTILNTNKEHILWWLVANKLIEVKVRLNQDRIINREDTKISMNNKEIKIWISLVSTITAL